MTKEGDRVPNTQPWFGRTIIRSACKLDYGLAQELADTGMASYKTEVDWDIDRRPTDFSMDEVVECVENLYSVAMNRRQRRLDPETNGGGLSMQSVKVRVCCSLLVFVCWR